MGKFAQPAKQAASVVKAMQRSGAIRSLGTARGYTGALTRVAEYAKARRFSLRDLTPTQITDYLEQRGEEVAQKTLDMERQAAQAMLIHITEQLDPETRLPIIQSERQQVLTSRMYTPAQVTLIAETQRTENTLTTRIAYAAGLRAHELFTLRPYAERAPSDRPALATKFLGRDGERYTVQGKGGLIREVRLPIELSKQLEARRLDTPRRVTDREISYRQDYAISGGQRWSNSFSQASKRTLGWSAGAHGLRHSYAQERMEELQTTQQRSMALEIVSQEMGHFRAEITEVYLR